MRFPEKKFKEWRYGYAHVQTSMDEKVRLESAARWGFAEGVLEGGNAFSRGYEQAEFDFKMREERDCNKKRGVNSEEMKTDYSQEFSTFFYIYGRGRVI